MSQLSYPFQDVSAGNWSPVPVATQLRKPANAPALDLTFAATAAAPAGDTFEVLLDRCAYPGAGPVTLSVRLRNTDPTVQAQVQAHLLQGYAFVAAGQVTPGGAFATAEFRLSAAEKAAITNYGDLRLLVSVGAPTCTGCAAFAARAARRFAFTPSGIANSFCQDCAGVNVPTVIAWQGGCTWSGPATFCGYTNPTIWSLTYQGGGTWGLQFGIDAYWSVTALSWDGLSPLTLSYTSGPNNVCKNYPAQITLAPA